jgi:L-threonylcarbamoyladenylate synthase
MSALRLRKQACKISPVRGMAIPQHVNPCLLSTAAETLALGHLVAFPTETVYGLGADGLNPRAVAKIFGAKGRPADHPVILHVADVSAAKSLAAQWPEAADRLAQAFWPGPLTLILKRSPTVPDAVTGGQDTVGIRIPSHPVALDLLREFAATGSGVIAAPSANRFGAISPTRAADVADSIGDRLGPYDLILDGGECAVGVESTIVDLSGDAPRILRPGGVGRDAITDVLALSDSASTPRPRVSGALASHYAPKAKTELISDVEFLNRVHLHLTKRSPDRLGCLVFSNELSLALQGLGVMVQTIPADPKSYAHDLYARLNDIDRRGVDVLLIEQPPSTIAWEAVLDRLRRASYDGQ